MSALFQTGFIKNKINDLNWGTYYADFCSDGQQECHIKIQLAGLN